MKNPDTLRKHLVIELSTTFVKEIVPKYIASQSNSQFKLQMKNQEIIK